MRQPLIAIFIYSLLLILPACAPHEDHGHEEEEHHSDSEIVFEPHQAESFGVEYETVEPGDFRGVIKTSGIIESSPGDIITLTARKRGIVALSEGINPGKEVKSGETVAVISANGLEGGDASMAAAVNLESALKEYERLKPLYEQGLVTLPQFREAERAFREAQAVAGSSAGGVNSRVTATADGAILNIPVKSGEIVEPGTPVATISKNINLTLKADLPVRYSKLMPEIETANIIPEGGSSLIRLKDRNGKKISGVSSAVVNGYLPIYFSFSGDALLCPGGVAEVYLLGKERTGVISIPRDGIIELQGNKYAYVYDGSHGYEKRRVVTGADNGERVEILEGLKEGERVVSKGASVIRMAEVSSIAPPSHTHNH